MKACLTILPALLLVMACFGQSSAPPKPVNKQDLSVLVTMDQLRIREVQLVLAQAHIARLQAEARVKEAEQQINQIVQELKVQYACPDCTLNADMTWTKPAPPAPESKTPAPPEDGQTSTKEQHK